jgi:hypothetical protein
MFTKAIVGPFSITDERVVMWDFRSVSWTHHKAELRSREVFAFLLYQISPPSKGRHLDE